MSISELGGFYNNKKNYIPLVIGVSTTRARSKIGDSWGAFTKINLIKFRVYYENI